MPTNSSHVKVMALRRPDVCSRCTMALPAGERAAWNRVDRTVTCLTCHTAPPTTSAATAPTAPTTTSSALAGSRPPVDDAAPDDTTPPHEGTTAAPAPEDQPGDTAQPLPRPGDTAGASARRQFERRSTRHADDVRARHPHLGGLLLALRGPRSTDQRWAQGAGGEEVVGAVLARRLDERVMVLHDRAMRQANGRLSRANIDHLLITPTGVWIVDTKTHHGRLQVERTGGWLSPRRERLLIAGRNQTKLLEGLTRQRQAVTRELTTAGHDTVAVHVALCFVGTDLPWRSLDIAGVPLLTPRRLVRQVLRDGPLTATDRDAVAQVLHDRFPPAT